MVLYQGREGFRGTLVWIGSFWHKERGQKNDVLKERGQKNDVLKPTPY
jgi:hypothetical protein